mgnify:FL=1
MPRNVDSNHRTRIAEIIAMTGMDMKTVNLVVDAYLHGISDNLANLKTVLIPSVGTIYFRWTPGRKWVS